MAVPRKKLRELKGEALEALAKTDELELLYLNLLDAQLYRREGSAYRLGGVRERRAGAHWGARQHRREGAFGRNRRGKQRDWVELLVRLP